MVAVFLLSHHFATLLLQCIGSLEQEQMYLHPWGLFFFQSHPDLASTPSSLPHSEWATSVSSLSATLIKADLTLRGYTVIVLLCSRKRKPVVLVVSISMSFVLLSVMQAITQIILCTAHKYTFDQTAYNLRINIAADISTMLCRAARLLACNCTYAPSPDFFGRWPFTVKQTYTGATFSLCL